MLRELETPKSGDPEKPAEFWVRDAHDPDLWHGPKGVMVNGAALREREAYYRVVRRDSPDTPQRRIF
jgi:hypothetical protein